MRDKGKLTERRWEKERVEFTVRKAMERRESRTAAAVMSQKVSPLIISHFLYTRLVLIMKTIY